MGQQDLGRVRLTVDIHEKDFFTCPCHPGGKGNRGRGFSGPAFLRGDGNDHGCEPAESHVGISVDWVFNW